MGGLNSIWGVLLTVLVPFGVLGLASAVRKLGAGVEVSRKLVHILLSNWILLALEVYNTACACIIPACFVILNYFSYRRGIFSAIEREEGNTPGTVWYAVSLFLLCLAGYSLNLPWIAACGMLAMGYGDGIGALIGKKWGKLHFPGKHAKKSVEGMLAVTLFSGAAVWSVCAVYGPVPQFALRAAAACAIPAAAIELFTPQGADNLTLPLGVSLIVFLLVQYPSLWPVFLCLDLTLLILIAAYYLHAISFSGLLTAALLGVSLFLFGGWLIFSALILFFILGSAVSRAGKQKKSAATALHEREGARSVVQVLANGLPSLIFAVLYTAAGAESYLLAALACFASTTADTFASEIGMLSKQQPISILTLKPIQRGLSGGVTLLGLFGAALGSGILSLLALPRFGALGLAAVLLTGFISAMLDSVLGAAFQAKYRLPDSGGGQLTERKSFQAAQLRLASGLRWVNNDVVNFASVLICGFLPALIW